MRMRAGIAAATSMMALATGACTEVDPMHQVVERIHDNRLLTEAAPSHMIMSDEEKHDLATRYRDIVRFGGSKVTARLVLVEGEQEFVCHDAYSVQGMVTSRNGAQYCTQPNAVVMTGAWMRVAVPEYSQNDPEEAEAVLDFTLGHEAGHSQEPPVVDRTSSVILEHRADCRAGKIMRSMIKKGVRDRSAIKNTTRVIGRLIEDSGHGTNEDRADAYMRGVKGGDCSQISEL